MKKSLCLLGASGSIGTQSIDCLKNRLDEYSLDAVSVGVNILFLEKIINEFNIKYVCVKNKEDYFYLKNKYKNIIFYYGDEGILELIINSNCDFVLNALSGFLGVKPTLLSLKLNKTVLLANKESLVVAGDLVLSYLDKGEGKIYPIDSEHAAITKCLKNIDKSNLKKIYITCSGGPFFNLDKNEFKSITLNDALNHPTYKMGRKITIDSSTLMNKAFEIIEAYYLFNVSEKMIDVKIDRNSYVHSFIETNDGHFKLSVGKPDMHIQINDCLSLFKTKEQEFSDTEIDTIKNYKFYEVDYFKFPLINYGKIAIRKRGNFGLILNAANEVAVNAFLEGKINYFEINKIIDKIIAISDYQKELREEDLDSLNKYYTNLTLDLIEKGNY